MFVILALWPVARTALADLATTNVHQDVLLLALHRVTTFAKVVVVEDQRRKSMDVEKLKSAIGRMGEEAIPMDFCWTCSDGCSSSCTNECAGSSCNGQCSNGCATECTQGCPDGCGVSMSSW